MGAPPIEFPLVWICSRNSAGRDDEQARNVKPPDWKRPNPWWHGSCSSPAGLSTMISKRNMEDRARQERSAELRHGEENSCAPRPLRLTRRLDSAHEEVRGNQAPPPGEEAVPCPVRQLRTDSVVARNDSGALSCCFSSEGFVAAQLANPSAAIPGHDWRSSVSKSAVCRRCKRRSRVPFIQSPATPGR